MTRPVPILTTTDATPLVALVAQVPDTNMVVAQATVVALASDGSAAYWILTRASKRVAGVTALVGTLGTLKADKDLGATTWDATLRAAGDTLALQVTGEAGKTIEWRAHVEVMTLRGGETL